jgi:ElaB/YqjD/DUF883 family membrane-anchored ribosome-binding protein
MNNEKIIKKIIKQADETNCTFPEEKMINVSLEEFSGINGKILFDKNKLSLYKVLGEKCFKYKIEEEKVEKEVKEKTDNNILTQVSMWGNNLKRYVDTRNELLKRDIEKTKEEIEKSQEEFLKEIKEYVDLNIKQLKKEKQSSSKKEVKNGEEVISGEENT